MAEIGNRLEVKSKAEDTLKVRPWPGLPLAAGFMASSGSSCSSESFRDEDIPEREEEEDEEVRGPGELEAKLASSRLSRACGWRLEYGRDIVCVPFYLCILRASARIGKIRLGWLSVSHTAD